jgi:hypothetical protein
MTSRHQKKCLKPCLLVVAATSNKLNNKVGAISEGVRFVERSVAGDSVPPVRRVVMGDDTDYRWQHSMAAWIVEQREIL